MFDKTRATVAEVSNNVAEYGRSMATMLVAILAVCVMTFVAVIATGVRRAN